MNIAVVTSDFVRTAPNSDKGTEIFVSILLQNLLKYTDPADFSFTAFCSGDSDVPVPIISTDEKAISTYEDLPLGKHIIFELALISKAFQMQDSFDLYHMHIGNGDIVMPFIPFVNKPVLITIHYTTNQYYTKKYFSLFQDMKNVHFISISNTQRAALPDLPYVKTIYHGIDTANNFQFHPQGGNSMMWAGRAIPEKGIDLTIDVAQKTKKPLQLHAIPKLEHKMWFEEHVEKRLKEFSPDVQVTLSLKNERLQLASFYQQSKLFLFPIQWEEPFGLVMIESMSCGTPVIAYARGAVPEVIKDGETGFIVNSSPEDIRGDWVIKKTGIEGLCEAVERIYAMDEKEYQAMREACRAHAVKNFSVERMIGEYVEVYKKFMVL